MKNSFLLIFSFVFISFCTALSAQAQAQNQMELSSSSFAQNSSILKEQVYTRCGGENISPDLTWKNTPDGTKSFALIMHDPDAPRAGGFYHWLVINIPADKTFMAKGEKIKGAVELKNDFQEYGYGGPCPPSGQHRYNFTIYALNIDKLDGLEQSSPKEVENLVKAHALAHSTLTGLYQR